MTSKGLINGSLVIAGGGRLHSDVIERFIELAGGAQASIIVIPTAQEEFVVPIKLAHAVWFTGGRQWRLTDAYLHTKVHQELKALLGRGGAIWRNFCGCDNPRVLYGKRRYSKKHHSYG